MPPWKVAFALEPVLITRSGAGVAASAAAAGALAAVRRQGGRIVVITSEPPETVAGWLSDADLFFDEIIAPRQVAADVILHVDHVGSGVGDLAGLPGWLERRLLPARLTDLEERLRGLGSMLVAFSGGSDSAFVLAAAARALGADRVVAATAVSASLSAAEFSAARQFAAGLGVRHLTPATNELSNSAYRANGGDRCYFCKAELLDVLAPIARREGLAAIATGTNADDLRAGFRPGIRAAGERGAVTPLADAGLTKQQVRLASRDLGLPTWDKPAAACLSSRIAYGVEVTPQRLRRVERAERALRVACASAGLAVRDLRVRDLGRTARVEVDRDLVPTLAARPDLLGVVTGFESVAVDPRGFRSGSMNELLPDPQRWR